MFHALAKAFALLVIVGMPAVVTAQDKPSRPRFVPGEVIVKFSSKSKAAAWMTPKEGTSEPKEPLVSYVRLLSDELGIPVQVKRLNSGGSVVLSISQSQLICRLMERVRANGSVKDARAMLVEGSAPPTESALEVEFVRGSPEEKVVSQVASSGRETGPELQSIKEKLERDFASPLVIRVLTSAWLQIKLDLNALTLDLVDRLRKRDDVEFVQPNFIRGPMGVVGEPPLSYH